MKRPDGDIQQLIAICPRGEHDTLTASDSRLKVYQWLREVEAQLVERDKQLAERRESVKEMVAFVTDLACIGEFDDTYYVSTDHPDHNRVELAKVARRILESARKAGAPAPQK